MKKLIFLFVLPILLLFCLYLSSRAESATIEVPVDVNFSQGMYVYTFNQRIPATTLEIIAGGFTKTLTTTGTIIDISGVVISSTVELALTGSATSITMIESDNPNEPFIIFSSIEDLRFHYTKYFNKIYIPTAARN